uniref:O-antigen polymerase n=1 Tax=Yersinia pseudotuberculosis TaxID=633 RepID=G4WJB5_YERPU|nr:O-antigen polymerase [Yersinia pseudotuberculosis]
MIERFLFFSLSLYLIFIPLGNALLFISGDLKIDVVISIYLFLISVFYYIGSRSKFSRINILYFLLFLLLFFSFVVSSVFSDNILKSIEGSVIILGYAWISGCFAFFLSDKKRINYLYNILFIALVISLIIQIISVSGIIDNPWRRATIPVVVLQPFSLYIPSGDIKTDPNVLAFGIVLTYFFLLSSPLSLFKRFLLFFIVLSSLIMTESRSACIGFAFCMIMYIIHNIHSKKKTVFRFNNVTILFMLTTIVFFILYLYFEKNVSNSVIERFLSVGNDASSNTRLYGINLSVELIADSDMTSLFIGHGVNSIFSHVDPHNIFIAATYNQGFLGLFVIVSYFILMLFFASKSDEYKTLSYSITLFLFIISNFYWQTKILWVGFLFVMILYYRCERRCLCL